MESPGVGWGGVNFLLLAEHSLAKGKRSKVSASVPGASQRPMGSRRQRRLLRDVKELMAQGGPNVLGCLFQELAQDALRVPTQHLSFISEPPVPTTTAGAPRLWI